MLSCGTDIVEIARLQAAVERHGEAFLARVYTARERLYARGRVSELAARFAAKEATAKALGVGMRLLSPAGIGWHEVEVLNDSLGKPYLVLSGRAAELARQQGLTEWSVSLTHDGGLALAFVVALGR
jgi:holo-[acyl-carrier protein] synthase